MSSQVSSKGQPVLLEVGGQRLRLAANADPDHLTRLADLVNERFQAQARASRSAPVGTVFALVALDLMDEIVRLREDAARAEQESGQKLARVERHAAELEQAARRAIVEAIAEIDRTLLADEELRRRSEERGASA